MYKEVTEPKIFLVGETRTNQNEINDYFKHIQVENWTTDTTNDIEYLCEFYGRGCYESWNTEKNLNLTRVRTGNKNYLNNIIKSKHGSVLEHTWLNWKICDVSRVFTHELVRHRVGTAISQQSLRYFRTDNLGFWIPNSLEEILLANNTNLTIEDVESSKEIIIRAVQNINETMKQLVVSLKLDNPKISFDAKKKINSLIRRIAPEGMATDIGWSCNVRTLRHLLEMRTHRSSEEEIRLVFGKIGYKIKEHLPNLFDDFKIEIIDGLPEFTTEYSKI